MKAEGQGGSSRSRQTSHFGGAAQWESRPEALRRRGRGRREGEGIEDNFGLLGRMNE